MPARPLLEVEGLTFRYRRAAEPAVRDLSVSLEAGEVLLVAGPSGCGKSTLIRAINGLIPHAYRGDLAGSVRLKGRSTAEMRLREIALLVGTMLQDPAKQIVGSSVEGELAFGPENLGLDRGEIRRRISEVVERTRIGSLAGRETAWLSGGEQQLLAMAGTLMMRPRLFVIDEPLANLDPETASRLLNVLRELADEGHAVVIVVRGPNGSGKTTMLRAAMRLVEPVAGRVMVDGQAARSRTTAELARIFGYVFQSPSQMLFARTVREELLFGPRNMGILPPDPEALAAEALDRTALSDLDGILERPPLTLSFGQQKRLALAIALALRPPTLVLDEPSAGQDHRSSAAFMDAIRAIPGMESIYLITHDVDLALSHADRILVLRDGRVAADGPPMRVIEDEDRWFAANLHRTSLIDANRRWRNPWERFLHASGLARWVLERERLHGPAENLAAAE